MKDLKQEFLKARLNKAQQEIKAILDKHQLLLNPELQYLDEAIVPIIKLVERQQVPKQESSVPTAMISPEESSDLILEAPETALDKNQTTN